MLTAINDAHTRVLRTLRLDTIPKMDAAKQLCVLGQYLIRRTVPDQSQISDAANGSDRPPADIRQLRKLSFEGLLSQGICNTALPRWLQDFMSILKLFSIDPRLIGRLPLFSVTCTPAVSDIRLADFEIYGCRNSGSRALTLRLVPYPGGIPG